MPDQHRACLKDEIQRLQSQITTLEAENARLAFIIDQMSSEIARLIPAEAGPDCLDRLSQARALVDALHLDGLRAGHPNLVDAMVRLKDAEKECTASNDEDMDCTSRLEILTARRGRMLDAGRSRKHPDYIAATRQIEAIRRECRAQATPK